MTVSMDIFLKNTEKFMEEVKRGCRIIVIDYDNTIIEISKYK